MVECLEYTFFSIHICAQLHGRELYCVHKYSFLNGERSSLSTPYLQRESKPDSDKEWKMLITRIQSAQTGNSVSNAQHKQRRHYPIEGPIKHEVREERNTQSADSTYGTFHVSLDYHHSTTHQGHIQARNSKSHVRHFSLYT